MTRLVDVARLEGSEKGPGRVRERSGKGPASRCRAWKVTWRQQQPSEIWGGMGRYGEIDLEAAAAHPVRHRVHLDACPTRKDGFGYRGGRGWVWVLWR